MSCSLQSHGLQRHYTNCVRERRFGTEPDQLCSVWFQVTECKGTLGLWEQNVAELLQETKCLIAAQESWITECNVTVEEMRVLKAQCIYYIVSSSRECRQSADLSILRTQELL